MDHARLFRGSFTAWKLHIPWHGHQTRMYEPMLEYLRCVRTSAKRGIGQWRDENLRMSLGGVIYYAGCVVSWYRCIVRFEVQVYNDVRIVAQSALSDDAWLPQEPQYPATRFAVVVEPSLSGDMDKWIRDCPGLSSLVEAVAGRPHSI